MFKALIGKDHPEFSTKRQQDAQEFLLHIINTIEVHARACACAELKMTPILLSFFFHV